jgi:UDP-N-acetylglucosamine acyltransferase
MPNIHPTAIVDRNARIADDVQIGPYTMVGPKVTIGKGTVIGSHCVLEGRTTIGQYNRIFHHVTLGQEPQDLKYRGEDATLIVGDHNDIRELVTMHIGTANGGGSTTVGSHNLFMVNVHIAHDCHVGSHCILANNVMLAGHVNVEDHAVISGAAAISHFVTVGQYAFIGGLSAVVTDCPPYMSSDGHPARVRSFNKVGLVRHRFDPESIDAIGRAYVLIFGKRARNLAAGLEEAEARLGHDPYVTQVIQFVRRAAAAPHGRHLESLRPDNKRVTPTR